MITRTTRFEDIVLPELVGKKSAYSVIFHRVYGKCVVHKDVWLDWVRVSVAATDDGHIFGLPHNLSWCLIDAWSWVSARF